MKKTLITFAIGLALFSSCAKKGDVGPTGTSGTNGNANVYGTTSFTVYTSTWIKSSSNNYYFNWDVPQITQSVVDKGEVQVYLLAGTNWIALPFTDGKNSTLFSFGLGGVKILNGNTDGTLPTNPGSQTYRIVVIPASN